MATNIDGAGGQSSLKRQGFFRLIKARNADAPVGVVAIQPL